MSIRGVGGGEPQYFQSSSGAMTPKDVADAIADIEKKIQEGKLSIEEGLTQLDELSQKVQSDRGGLTEQEKMQALHEISQHLKSHVKDLEAEFARRIEDISHSDLLSDQEKYDKIAELSNSIHDNKHISNEVRYKLLNEVEHQLSILIVPLTIKLVEAQLRDGKISLEEAQKRIEQLKNKTNADTRLSPAEKDEALSKIQPLEAFIEIKVELKAILQSTTLSLEEKLNLLGKLKDRIAQLKGYQTEALQSWFVTTEDLCKKLIPEMEKIKKDSKSSDEELDKLKKLQEAILKNVPNEIQKNILPMFYDVVLHDIFFYDGGRDRLEVFSEWREIVLKNIPKELQTVLLAKVDTVAMAIPKDMIDAVINVPPLGEETPESKIKRLEALKEKWNSAPEPYKKQLMEQLDRAIQKIKDSK